MSPRRGERLAQLPGPRRSWRTWRLSSVILAGKLPAQSRSIMPLVYLRLCLGFGNCKLQTGNCPGLVRSPRHTAPGRIPNHGTRLRRTAADSTQITGRIIGSASAKSNPANRKLSSHRLDQTCCSVPLLIVPSLSLIALREPDHLFMPSRAENGVASSRSQARSDRTRKRPRGPNRGRVRTGL